MMAVVTDEMVDLALAAGSRVNGNRRIMRAALEAALNPPAEPAGWLTKAQLKAGCDALRLDPSLLSSTNQVVNVVAAVLKAGPIKPSSQITGESAIVVTEEMTQAALDALSATDKMWREMKAHEVAPLMYRAMRALEPKVPA